MKKLLLGLLLMGLCADVALASYYSIFGPATGILKGSATSPQTTAAASSDVIALWTGTCSSGTFLRGDGSCVAVQAPVLTGTSSSIGGGALAAGACASTTVTVTGAATTMVADSSPVADPGAGNYWQSFVSAANTVTVRICATVAGTPTATTYNVRVIP